MLPPPKPSPVMPTRAEDVALADSADEFLRQFHQQRGSQPMAKVVVALAEGKGLVAIGPRELYHVDILSSALLLHRGLFEKPVVTTLSAHDTRAAQNAVVQGAWFVVADWRLASVLVLRSSTSYGPITQRICGANGEDFVAELIATRIRALGLT